MNYFSVLIYILTFCGSHFSITFVLSFAGYLEISWWELQPMSKVIFIFLLSCSLLFLSGCTGYDGSVPQRAVTFANVTEVIDGDTFVISTGEKVRLIGVDTPERGSPIMRKPGSIWSIMFLEELSDLSRM